MNLVTRPVAELEGPALDWAVAKVEGIPARLLRNDDGTLFTNPVWADGFGCYAPSINWSRCGPLIEKYDIDIVRCNDLHFPKGNEHGDFYELYYKATNPGGAKEYGPTPLIATCRAIVAMHFGNTVRIPEELTCPTTRTSK